MKKLLFDKVDAGLRLWLTPKAGKIVAGKTVNGITGDDLLSYHYFLEWLSVFDNIEHSYNRAMKAYNDRYGHWSQPQNTNTAPF